ncbi:hypothetical protein FRC02_008861 [Tulasnella sp. 418]|nr:hypothetical protein FRC02_008861 [Tulasnella sp. 418]
MPAEDVKVANQRFSGVLASNTAKKRHEAILRMVNLHFQFWKRIGGESFGYLILETMLRSFLYLLKNHPVLNSAHHCHSNEPKNGEIAFDLHKSDRPGSTSNELKNGYEIWECRDEDIGNTGMMELNLSDFFHP